MDTPYVPLSLEDNTHPPEMFVKAELRKQKIKSYPRLPGVDHYYNRVVRHANSPTDDGSVLFFVLNFDIKKDLLLIVPMSHRGVLTGKREGRDRYQLVIDGGDDDDATSASTHNFSIVPRGEYDVVRSAMVMKTPIIYQEAWDVEMSSDQHFETR